MIIVVKVPGPASIPVDNGYIAMLKGFYRQFTFS